MSLYTVIRAILVFFCRVALRARVVGLEHVPPTGAYVVAPTHRSGFDIPLAAMITTRKLRYLAKDELFRTPVGARLFPVLGAIRVERGTADRGALRALEGAVHEGSPVVMFPEGTRGSGPVLGPMFAGAAYLAVRTGVPIVPVGIGGSEGIMRKGSLIPRLRRVVVVVGEPLVPQPTDGGRRRDEVDALTARLRTSLQAVFDDALGRAGVAPVSSR